ncbi:MAG: trypsin-like peptidase domain-containing protein [Capsulimonadales bacterium]|nr:trypsin-like peptidase domain-containing protein [Capsulimonadales bacterium]
MPNNGRLRWGIVSVGVVGFASGALLLPLGSRSVVAQETSALTTSQLNVATSLEGAFMHVAETVGPATVSISASETLPEPRRSNPEARPRVKPSPSTPDNDSDPLDDLFGPNANPFRRSPRSATATGSGVIIRPDGYILTNDHITESARNRTVTVTLADGTVYKGKVLRDFTSDLAVVRIQPEKPLPFIRIGDSGKVRVGQWAVAIGSPFGQQNTVTTGIVSALHRKRMIGDSGDTRLYPNLIQTDASINPGNSGGPLLNIHGELIGINVAIYSPTGTSLGIGYAIPANTAKMVADQLIAQGKVVRGSLGVVPDDVPPGLRRRLGTNNGAYIKEIPEDGPAYKAGLRVEDVITAFNTRPITSENDLREAIAMTAPGTRVLLSVLRRGQEEKITAILGERREDTTPRTAVENDPARQLVELGFEAAPLTTEMVTQRRLPAGIKGLLVRSVTPGGLAQQEGLITGSVIVGINGTPISTSAGLDQVIAKTKPGDTVTLEVLQRLPGEKPSRAAINISVP